MARKIGPRKTRRSEDRVEFRVLAEVLKEVRQEAGLSARRLSLRLEKDDSFIAKIERGTRYPDFVTLLEIAKITEVPAAEIVAAVEARLKTTK